MKMITLLKNADVYAPRHLGKRDVLLAGSKIAAVEPEIKGYENCAEVEVIDLAGAKLGPGYIDQHVHITGGGGEQGFSSRVPEIKLTELTCAGVTTVVGLLGTDGVTRSMENLLAKAGALADEGITTYCLTGSYGYPSVTLTGSVEKDIVLHDRIIGVKVALSDHRDSGVTADDLIRLGAAARRGGLLSGKPGIVAIHMGDGAGRMNPIFEALERSDIPAGILTPTHVERNPRVAEDAIRYTQMKGYTDFTAYENPTEERNESSIIAENLRKGADPAFITMSSDGCGSLPVFNDEGECIGLSYTTPKILHKELKLMVNTHGIPMETALAFFTANPARLLKKEGVKGAVAEGADADLIVYDGAFEIDRVYALGKLAVAGGKPVMRGRFELGL